MSSINLGEEFVDPQEYQFNHEFIIIGHTIISRKYRSSFKINDMLFNYLNNFIKSNKIKLSEEVLAYLVNKKIIVKHGIYEDEEFSPFVVLAEGNRLRLFIQITNKCNLFCKHCFETSGAGNEDRFDYNSLKNILDEAIAKGFWRIDFTGGEVFTKNYFCRILRYLDKFPVSYNLFTNLTLLDNATIDLLGSLSGLNQVLTSLDYFNPQKHDDFRGREGAFNRTLDTINKLANRDVNISVNVMVQGDNHIDILRMIDYFIPRHIGVHFDTIINCGRANELANSGELSHINQSKNIDFMVSCIKLLKDKYGINMNQNSSTCGVGENLVFLGCDGVFSICPGLTHNISQDYYMGNNLDEACLNLVRSKIECSDYSCKLRKDCSQGCRMRAFRDFGDPTAPDPAMCEFMFKKAIRS